MNEKEKIQALAEEKAAEFLGVKIQVFDELIERQKKLAHCSEYQVGIYNGLVLGRSILTGKKPEYYEQEGGDEDGK